MPRGGRRSRGRKGNDGDHNRANGVVAAITALGTLLSGASALLIELDGSSGPNCIAAYAEIAQIAHEEPHAVFPVINNPEERACRLSQFERSLESSRAQPRA